jgi:hypothetical protein
MEETVRPIVLAGVRSCLVAFLIAAVLNFPVAAASATPLGVVLASRNARLDNAGAVNGANVYPGDALSTGSGGSLRLKIGESQVYLLSSSAATLVQQENKIQAKVDRGILGFSVAARGQLEIATPLGIIRAANGQRVYGLVAVLNPTRMQVTSKKGTLVVAAANGPEKVIAPGETYEANLAAVAGSPDVGPQGVGSDRINWKRVAGVLIVAGSAATVAAIIWHEETESCSVPSSCD